jgi:pyrroloquinoline quinone (PQQ) biosynthesis protein C
MLRLGQDKEFAEILALKASQEASHELWALADAMALGESEEAVITAPPSLVGNLYIAWNQFIVEGPTPIAFLGTAYTLERLSIERGAVAVSNLRAHSTIPGIQQALTFLEGHAYEDLSHTDLLEVKLEGIHSEQERELTIESVRMTGRFYEGLLRSIADDANMTT